MADPRVSAVVGRIATHGLPVLFDGYSPYREYFAWVVRQVGIDRLLFASDFPLDNPVEAFDALDRLGFTEDEVRLIAHDNAANLFGLDEE